VNFQSTTMKYLFTACIVFVVQFSYSQKVSTENQIKAMQSDIYYNQRKISALEDSISLLKYDIENIRQLLISLINSRVQPSTSVNSQPNSSANNSASSSNNPSYGNGYNPSKADSTKRDGLTPSTGATIYTGPRGGQYYINKNGNKTYIKHN
jgi:hypothetical protein